MNDVIFSQGTPRETVFGEEQVNANLAVRHMKPLPLNPPRRYLADS